MEGDISCALTAANLKLKKMAKIKNMLPVFVKKNFVIIITGLSLLIANNSPLVSHEMWLDTTTYQQKIDAEVKLSLVNGQMFDGFELSYFKSRFSEFYYINNNKKVDIESRMGDTPAATLSFSNNGLVTGIYISEKSTINYETVDKFSEFAVEKGEGWAIKKHSDLKFPKMNFKEDYYRFSKILIGVGNSKGSDIQAGIKHEIVALTNPYNRDSKDKFYVKLIFNDKPQKNRQITIFERDLEKNVTTQVTFTDDDGIAKFKVIEGNEYLIDNVIIEVNEDPENDAVWSSYWAALTFRALNATQ
ncbi:MAG: hypothetical protein CBC71_09840 [Rhodobacteraceae bacterium TMED111]|nr:hypothetical protein [Marinovum sp.]OUV39193.1 MAG: hypothetical protein CBC71_09840 [Rhodobacteraceae bacterium TMED111]